MSNNNVITKMKPFTYKPPKLSIDVKKLKSNPSDIGFDRSKFITKIPLVCVAFPNPQNIGIFCKKFKSDILHVERLQHIVKLAKPSPTPAGTGNDIKNKKVQLSKGILLKDEITSIDQVTPDNIAPNAYKFLIDNDASITGYDYICDYDFWKTDEILSSIIPVGYCSRESLPSSFTATGHIAHVNLRDEFKPYSRIIGQIIIDKNQPKIKMVVNKLDSINSKFRTFDMEILSCIGDGSSDSNVFEVQHRESDCLFTFDFSKVYWNSRLHTEHDRLISKFKPGQVVGDVFAGVGPFSVPAGKKKVFVLSNDLNPFSYKYMCLNIKDNKVGSYVRPYNMDGGEFIKKSISLLNEWYMSTGNKNGEILITKGGGKYKDETTGKVLYKDEIVKLPRFYHHYVMNLPDTAINFLGNFVGLYNDHQDLVNGSDGNTTNFQLPCIHVHCFEKFSPEETHSITMEELHHRMHQRILKIMGTTEDVLLFNKMEFHLVRKVAPTKPMFCVSFELPMELAITTI
ncbi:tRNA (guanine) methyltransferase SCDLUD_004657 [Saccharomycodes ludwigii]|uniref:tRNA (guanine) methyltransferase n=1 Tax=Saccharomycodes ludwigii TaxID=36035 RepID=UPI001E883D21|nr:hypothetical protein SCDLUD_004657 [Saccharomycodes ludwigii]KAH3899225.1 hypothetical protein SCDLUD_004657 [Saccharomycodes ludwigii]